MTFSASPLVPGQESGGVDDWKQAAQRVLTAVNDSLGQIPSDGELLIDAPTDQAEPGQMPDPAGTAITGYMGGKVEGKLLIVVGQELIEALSGAPFGAVETSQALQPAMESLAGSLGGRVDGPLTEIGIDGCLDVLAGGTTVLVPILSGANVYALIGVTFSERASAPPTASTVQTTAGAAARSWGIDMLRDVEMEVTCELGRTRMTVRQLLALSPGHVVELDRLAGSPADLLVNGTLLARGEVVVVDESFGLRITEIVTKEAT
jgi:flagellar motor switch protein FliN/FliY